MIIFVGKIPMRTLRTLRTRSYRTIDKIFLIK